MTGKSGKGIQRCGGSGGPPSPARRQHGSASKGMLDKRLFPFQDEAELDDPSAGSAEDVFVDPFGAEGLESPKRASGMADAAIVRASGLAVAGKSLQADDLAAGAKKEPSGPGDAAKSRKRRQKSAEAGRSKQTSLPSAESGRSQVSEAGDPPIVQGPAGTAGSDFDGIFGSDDENDIENRGLAKGMTGDLPPLNHPQEERHSQLNQVQQRTRDRKGGADSIIADAADESDKNFEQNIDESDWGWDDGRYIELGELSHSEDEIFLPDPPASEELDETGILRANHRQPVGKNLGEAQFPYAPQAFSRASAPDIADGAKQPPNSRESGQDENSGGNEAANPVRSLPRSWRSRVAMWKKSGLGVPLFILVAGLAASAGILALPDRSLVSGGFEDTHRETGENAGNAASSRDSDIGPGHDQNGLPKWVGQDEADDTTPSGDRVLEAIDERMEFILNSLDGSDPSAILPEAERNAPMEKVFAPNDDILPVGQSPEAVGKLKKAAAENGASSVTGFSAAKNGASESAILEIANRTEIADGQPSGRQIDFDLVPMFQRFSAAGVQRDGDEQPDQNPMQAVVHASSAKDLPGPDVTPAQAELRESRNPIQEAITKPSAELGELISRVDGLEDAILIQSSELGRLHVAVGEIRDGLADSENAARHDDAPTATDEELLKFVSGEVSRLEALIEGVAVQSRELATAGWTKESQGQLNGREMELRFPGIGSGGTIYDRIRVRRSKGEIPRIKRQSAEFEENFRLGNAYSIVTADRIASGVLPLQNGRVGDRVPGYGKILDVFEDGVEGQLVVMEQGTVYIRR